MAPIGRIAQYEILEPLGRGGMSVVYLARDTRLGRNVALKLLPDGAAQDPERRERLLREARASAALSHSSIATCYDIGEAPLEPPDLLEPGKPGPYPDVLFLTMEYVPGGDLKDLIGDKPVDLDDVLAITIQVADALEAAHAHGIVHRDLKPGNVRLTPDHRVKVIDFGLARLLQGGEDSVTQEPITSSGRVLGTVLYMSPEQANGSVVDPRSDLFSLGTLLYELVTGRNPFQANTYLGVIHNIGHVEPPPLARYASGVPDELERIVRKLHEKNPDRRYQSAREVRLDLERLRTSISGIFRGNIQPSPRRRRWPLAAGATIAVLAIAALAAPKLLHRPLAIASHGIAVMPFANSTGDGQLDYLGEGLASDLSGDLVRRSRLNVASYSSVRGVGDRARDARAVSKELGVGAIVGGTVKRENGETYVEVELIDGARGISVWDGRYTYTLAGAQEIEERILGDVLKRVTGEAPGPDRDRAARTPSAYDFYLRANSLLDDPDDPQAPDRAIERYDAALALDPRYAPAWAGRSRASLRVWQRDKDKAALRSAADAAARALKLEPQSLEARLAVAAIDRIGGRYDAAIGALSKVVAERPEWDEAEVQLSAAYRDAGDYTRAESHLRKALSMRPDSWKTWNALGALLARKGDNDGARAAFRNIVRLVPDKNRGYEQIGAIEQRIGNFGAAVAMYEQLPNPVRDATLASNVATAYFFTNHLPEARRYYELAVGLEPNTAYWRMNLGDWYGRSNLPDSMRMAYGTARDLLAARLNEASGIVVPLQYALCQAKTGDCSAAAATLKRYGAAMPDSDADAAHWIARIEATCGRRTQAIAALARAVKFGFSPDMIRHEDEFTALADDPRYRSLIALR